MEVRNIREDDYKPIISKIDDWWGGRRMAGMLPKLFFQHFQDTSFAVLDKEQIVAFVVGFVSQTHPEQAYVHFVGVHPDYRKQGLAKNLYERFFAVVQERGCTEVLAVTSPLNKASIAFHLRLGFETEPGDAGVDGVEAKIDYDGRGESRVRFVRRLTAPEKTEPSVSSNALVPTLSPPYYAVVFTSLRTTGDNGYAAMADEMEELAHMQPGFLGVESARDKDGVGITVSYWDSEESIRAWRENSRHRIAQRLGREKWYENFVTRVCRVERVYAFNRRSQRGTEG